jgi:hypothetical protein
LATHLLSLAKRNSNRDAWLIAWALTLALHAALIVVLLNRPPLQATSSIHQIEPIQLVFQKPSPPGQRSETPQFFSELPPDRADAAPKKPDVLSNVMSRTRQPVPGEDAARPRMQGEADEPMVKLTPGGAASSPVMPLPAPQQNPPAGPTQSPQPRDASAEQQIGATGATPSQKPSEPTRPTAVGPQTSTSSPGNSDIYQPEMENPDGSAALKGDVSLSTTAWNYAPWLQRFGRQLMRQWAPPPAYTLGILKDGGWSVIEVEISRSGEMLRLQVLEAHGHPSLSQAAEGALRYMAPVERLPADFPDQTLTLRIRMIYPRIRSR